MGIARITLVISLTLLLAQACTGSCPDLESPCPEPFDVGEWCEANGGCTVDGMPAECAALRGCALEPGQLLSIPISAFDASLEAKDLRVTPINQSCGNGPGTEAEDFAVSLDDVSGVAVRLGSATSTPFTVFQWEPFPEAPQVLKLHYDIGTGCLDVQLSFVAGSCQAENSPPTCPG